MKKILFFLLVICSGVLSAQPYTVNIGTGPNSGNGDNLRAAFTKLNGNDEAAYDSIAAIFARWVAANDILRLENDSAYIEYLPTSNSTRWVGVSHTKGLYVDSTDNASFMTRWKDRPNLKESIDTAKGEFLWYTFDKNGIQTWRGIADIPRLGLQLQALTAGIEYNRLELYDRAVRIDTLEKQVEKLMKQDHKMSRLDYKLKLKLLKAEGKLK